MQEVPDPTFAGEVLGKGMAVIPTEGVVTAPCNGKIETLFDTKHAIGIVSEDGIEILVHIGINTVELEGKYYESHVAEGDMVAAGQTLITFDIAGIKAAGYDITTPVIITNSYEYQEVKLEQTGNIKRMDKALEVK